MSLTFMLPALDARPGELSAAERAVLVALAEDARAGVGMASPGHERLMAVSGLKARQVTNVLRKLAEKGLIVLHRAARTGQRAVWKLLIAERTRESQKAPQDAAQCRQNGQTGSNGGTSSTHTSAGLPGVLLPGKNPVARAREVASKITGKGSKVDYSATPWRAPSTAPDNKLVPTPRPDLSSLPVPPEWAIEAARTQLGRFAGRQAVMAVARTLAGVEA